ncbi:MAG: hypothetical protein ACK53L_15310 [Pirellulaceae bacterium]
MPGVDFDRFDRDDLPGLVARPARSTELTTDQPGHEAPSACSVTVILSITKRDMT